MKYANDYSGYGNEVLYRMCREKPLHTDLDIVSSKLWLIGRSYSAAIERRVGKDFSMETAAKLLINSNIDELIRKIISIERPTESNIHEILNAHRCFVDIIAKETIIEKRSLASKYLHFHSPKSVFLYDSRAKNRIREILRPIKRRFIILHQFDKEYTAFSYRCIYYRDNILEKKLGELVSPRRLDMELLGYSEGTEFI